MGVYCSEDPNNPEFGFSLTDVTLAQCLAEDAKMSNGLKKMEANEFKCISQIADEEEGTGAVFAEYGNSGKHSEAIKVRVAVRFSFDGDKALGYHAVWDSYNLIKRDDETLVG